MFSEARCPGSRRRCAAETQHCSCRAAVGPRPQQLWSARRSPSVSAAALELPLLGSNQDSPDPESGVLPVTPRGSDYGAEGARTPDLLGAIQALSQLSYSPVRARNITPLPLFSKQARVGLIVLTFINLFNYLDRWIVAALAESMKHSELHLSDTQLGSLMTGFLIVYILAAPLFGWFGDTRSRSRLLAIGVAIWSVATALAGFARGYGSLFAARAAVGIGEAAYGTISPALLADYFPRERRGRVFAVFFAAIPIGSALGYVVGGLVDRYFGWRQAFFVAGIPGLVLAALALRLYDPPRGAQDPDAPAAARSHTMGLGTAARAAYALLLRNRPYVLTVLGYAAYTFAIGALAFWTPSFLERARGIPKAAAMVQFGAVVVATGFLGTYGGGWLGDRGLRYSRQAYLWVSGGATLLAAPLTLLALSSPRPAVYWPAIVAAELCLFASTGPINSV